MIAAFFLDFFLVAKEDCFLGMLLRSIGGGISTPIVEKNDAKCC